MSLMQIKQKWCCGFLKVHSLVFFQVYPELLALGWDQNLDLCRMLENIKQMRFSHSNTLWLHMRTNLSCFVSWVNIQHFSLTHTHTHLFVGRSDVSTRMQPHRRGNLITLDMFEDAFQSALIVFCCRRNNKELGINRTKLHSRLFN